MRKVCFILFACLCLREPGRAQVPEDIARRIRLIVGLIKADKALEISKLVAYPLPREYPLPPIKTPADFVAYYPTLFDHFFKGKLGGYNDSMIFEHHGYYGLVGGDNLFAGDIWLDEQGKIATVNYSSARELQLQEELTRKVKSRMHPSIREWTKNVKLARSGKLLVRIDFVDTVLRYACWSKGKKVSEAPDLILYHGTFEPQGTMGGFTWTFSNKDWTYVVDQADMCDRPEQCGLFLELSYKGVLKSTVRLKDVVAPKPSYL